MQRIALLFLTAIIAVSSAFGQGPRQAVDLSNYGVNIEPDRRLMAVLATLEMASVKNAAGAEERVIRTPISDKSSAFRAQLAADNSELPADLRSRITNFVVQYKKRRPSISDADLIAPFISMAYTLSPVPDLADPSVTHDLPGSLLDVLDFAPLVREFYRRSTFSTKIGEYVKDYRRDADGILRNSARDMVSELLDYLHTRPQLVFTEKIKTQAPGTKSGRSVLQTVQIREHERRFFVVPERLTAKGNVNFLNIRDDYYVVVPPDADLRFSEARRAFLQFVLDPVVLKNFNEATPLRDWARVQLDEKRKSSPAISPDVFLMVRRSLVSAVDIRQNEFTQVRIATDQSRQRISQLTTDAEKRAVAAELDRFKRELSDETILKLFEEYDKGNLLSFYFAEQLRGVEDSGFDIASSMREMMISFDAAKETDRAESTLAARTRAAAARQLRKQAPESVTIVAENPVTRALIEIQKKIEAKDYTRASADLAKIEVENPGDPRVYFNMGRVAGLEAAAIDDPEGQTKKLLSAKEAYTNVIKHAKPSTEKALLSLTFVSLARIYEFNNDAAYAAKLYDEAIKLGDVTGGAFRDAITAKQRLIKER